MQDVHTHGLSIQVDQVFSLSHSQDPAGGKKNDGMLLDYLYFNYVWKDKYSLVMTTKTFLGYFLVAS